MKHTPSSHRPLALTSVSNRSLSSASRPVTIAASLASLLLFSGCAEEMDRAYDAETEASLDDAPASDPSTNQSVDPSASTGEVFDEAGSSTGAEGEDADASTQPDGDFSAALDPQAAPGCNSGPGGTCEACYGAYLWTGSGSNPPSPYFPVPDIINVYWDPQHITADGRLGNNANSLRVSEAREIAKTYFSEHQSQTGSAVRFRWMGAPDANMGQCQQGGHVPGRTPYIRLTTAPVGQGSGQATPRLVPGSTAMDCAEIRFDPANQWSTAGGADSWDRATPSTLGVTQDFLLLLTHEVGHAMRWSHASDDHCQGTEMETDDMGTGGTLSRRNWSLHRAEKRYMLNDYGRADYDAFALQGNTMDPDDRSQYSVAYNAISPITSTDGNDVSSGYAYNVWSGTAPRTQVRTYESGRGWETRSFSTSYHRPDVTRTIDRATDQWLVAALTGDSRKDRRADIQVWERDFGSGLWQGRTINVDTPFEHVSAAYDPLSDNYILTYVKDMMRVGWRVRDADGGVWADDPGLPDFAVSGGADVACSAFEADDGTNCVMVYVEERGPRRNLLRYRRFAYDHGTGEYVFGPQRSLGYYGNTKPSVASNPIDEDIHFSMVWDIGGSTIYSRNLAKDNTISWAQYESAPAGKWMRPAGLGTWVSGGQARQEVVLAK